MVLNFEARGSEGPALMFETSDGNGWLIKELARAGAPTRTNSILYEAYRRLPNETDMTMFKRAGYPGLNFAYIDGAARYHTQTDSLDQLDQRSLQHQGSYALALARHYGNLDLTNTKASNAVYFDLLGLTLIHYPTSWVTPLTIVTLLLFVVVAFVGLKKGRLTLAGNRFRVCRGRSDADQCCSGSSFITVQHLGPLSQLSFDDSGRHLQQRFLCGKLCGTHDCHFSFALHLVSSQNQRGKFTCWRTARVGCRDDRFRFICTGRKLSFYAASSLCPGAVGLEVRSQKADRLTAGQLASLYAFAIPGHHSDRTGPRHSIYRATCRQTSRSSWFWLCPAGFTAAAFRSHRSTKSLAVARHSRGGKFDFHSVGQLDLRL